MLRQRRPASSGKLRCGKPSQPFGSTGPSGKDGPKPTSIRHPDAAPQLHRTCHSYIVQRFRSVKVGYPDIRCEGAFPSALATVLKCEGWRRELAVIATGAGTWWKSRIEMSEGCTFCTLTSVLLRRPVATKR